DREYPRRTSILHAMRPRHLGGLWGRDSRHRNGPPISLQATVGVMQVDGASVAQPQSPQHATRLMFQMASFCALLGDGDDWLAEATAVWCPNGRVPQPSVPAPPSSPPPLFYN